MARTGVRIEGLTTVIGALTRIGVDMQDMRSTFTDIARDAARLARGFAPVRSGALRQSIRPSRSKNKATVSVGSVRVPYARIVNYGHRSKRRLFMQRADRAIRPTLVGRIERGLGEIIRRHGLS